MDAVRMIYLSGKIPKNTAKLGVMLSYNVGKQRTDGHHVYAVDNGCFANPGKYTDEGYFQYLSGLNSKQCLFAAAPDVVGNAEKTRQRAYPVLKQIRALGFKAAYVIQDGETPEEIRWDEMDAIFIGGSTDWKLGEQARSIVREAKKRGKWVHMGRVNSYRRMRYAQAIGCNSVDGTFLAFAPDLNEQRMINWIDRVQQQPALELH